MVYTLTLNPALDYHLFFDDFEQGALNVPSRCAMHAGGKGINVSRVLQRFGQQSTCVGFLGGFTGKFIANCLDKEAIQHHFIEVPDDTRINVKIKQNQQETEIAGISPLINNTAWETLKTWLIMNLKANDVLIMSGSVPPSVPPDAYSQLIKQLPDGVIRVLDTRGESLKQALGNTFLMVKPNRSELEEWVGEKLLDMTHIIAAARRMQSEGIKYLLVSLGAEGAVLVTDEYVLKADAPIGTVVSSVGSGDAMLAGFLYALSLETPWASVCDATLAKVRNSFAFAVAAGSANAFHQGICTPDQVKMILKQGISITRH